MAKVCKCQTFALYLHRSKFMRAKDVAHEGGIYYATI